MAQEHEGLKQLPPQEIEAEQMVLGACILDPRHTISQAYVRPDDFYKDRHRVIFAAMQAMLERGEQIDLVTLTSALRDAKELATVGAGAYLSELVALVPTAAHFRAHERLVVLAAQRRQVIRACAEMTQACYDLQEPDGTISAGIGRLNDIRRHEGDVVVKYGDMIARGYETVDRRSSITSGISGIPSGFAEVDRITDGWQPEYYVLAGRPSMGKTALAMQFVRHAARSSRKAGVISIEMGEGQLALRELAGESGVPISRMRRGEVRGHDWDQILAAGERLAPLPIWLTFSSFTDRQIERTIDDMVQRLGVALIGIDYLQLASCEGRKNNREDEVASISRMIKRKVKEHRIPIIALAQLNRRLEDRPDKRPTLADLRESGSIEQDADVIMFIYRDEVYNCKCPKDFDCSCGRRGKAELLFRKGRMIGTGDIDLLWDGKTTTFRDAH